MEAQATVPAMPVESEETKVGPLRAFVARPEGTAGPGPFPGVVVLHEIFGLNDDIRRIARRFAESGYVAMAPDLYSHGNRALCLTRVITDMLRGCRGETLDEIVGARVALANRPDVDANRVAVIGFCMGGGFALITGTTGGVQAAAVNYGPVPKDAKELDGLCPVVASYGALDKRFAKEGDRLKDHLERLGIPHDYKLYDGVGHSFLSFDNVPGWVAKVPLPMHVEYAEKEAEDAWSRILAFFATHV
jgi:carboxymethylenebutenolidase